MNATKHRFAAEAISKTYCAPASKARLIKSGWELRRRTSGEMPIDDIAATAVCIALSSILPCSQSMMIPYCVIVSVLWDFCGKSATKESHIRQFLFEQQSGLFERKVGLGMS